jgi:hypothetical protein
MPMAIQWIRKILRQWNNKMSNEKSLFLAKQAFFLEPLFYIIFWFLSGVIMELYTILGGDPVYLFFA